MCLSIGNVMFQLDSQEVANLRSQFVTASGAIVSATPTFGKRNVSARPYAFTEQGVAMLSAVLKSSTAIQVSIAIMETFVQIRKMVVDNREHALELGEVRTRLQLLEERLENYLGAVNDLSEDVRKEMDNIYEAIGELSIKQSELEHRRDTSKPNPIGYAATLERESKK